MPTNEEISARILEALSAKAPNAVCPICKKTDWAVGDGYVVLPVSTHPRKISTGGRILPLIAATCRNCGNTQLINLVRLGFNPEDFQDLTVTLNDE